MGFIASIRARPLPALMGILNTTPDSFYDGGHHLTPVTWTRKIETLIAEGADIIDIGGESSRPLAAAVPAEEQLQRVLPAVHAAVAAGALVSIDTTRADVADAVLAAGARIINDVSNLSDARLPEVVARHGAALVVTHSRAAMSEMAGFSQWPDEAYSDVVSEVRDELGVSRKRCLDAGVAPDLVWLDPGLGFTKNARHSFELLRRFSELFQCEAPLAVGPGRKSFIAALDGSAPEDRLGGTIAASIAAARAGADILRVHDVGAVRQSLLVTYAIEGRVPAVRYRD